MKELKENEVFSGFKLKSIKRVEDVASTMYEFEHLKSGATLVYLENEDTNKCFSLGFRTLPEDSTGICHILEHSVLCGSKKYPLKEPFVNLIKGSMATFLNAMTAQDFTIYPVASQNDNDFDNLVSVYLDAVLAPLSIIDDKPFLQEGWHIELNDVEDTPVYKGVVYNEMKGAMSSVDRQLNQATMSVLYENTAYAPNSGGDPDVIPELTYDYYKDFYKRHYNPDNGLFYFYGKMNILDKLAYIDSEYLSKYERSVTPVVIKEPTPAINTTFEKEYQISETEELENNTYIALAFVLDYYKNAADLKGFEILNSVLMSSNDSPLKKAILDAKLGTDVSAYVNDDCIKPSYYISLKKANDEKDRFYNVVMDTLKSLVKNGIDKSQLLAAINRSEFETKEMDLGGTPKGLIFSFSLMQSFNYNVPFETHLENTKYYDLFRKELNNGYFEGLIEKYLLNSNHYALVTLKPSKTLGEKKALEMAKKMEDLKNSMTKEEKEHAVSVTKKLFEYQSAQDTPEDLKTLPKLDLSEIKADVNTIPSIKDELNGLKVIKHNITSNHIGYLKMYFDLDKVSFDDLPYVMILLDILGNVDTKNYTVNDLQSYIKTYFGEFNLDMSKNNNSPESINNKLGVNVSALMENVDKMNNIIDEVLNNSVISVDTVKTHVNQLLNRQRSNIINNGMAIAISMASASKSFDGAISNKMQGLDYFNFLNTLDVNEKTVEKLYAISKQLFNKDNATVTISGDDETLSALAKTLDKLPLVDSKYPKALKPVLATDTSCGLIIPSEVNYNAMAANLSELGVTKSGKLLVLQHIVNYDYLWPEVRVKGGAYGCRMAFSDTEGCVMGSYRDPNVKNTFNAYEGIKNYLSNLALSKDELETYIIGAVGGFDKPLSNNAMVKKTDGMLFANITDDYRRNVIKEMLSTTVEDLKGYATMFEKFSKVGSTFTIGNEAKIKEYSFKEIKSL